MTVERFKFEYVEVDDEWELQLDDDGDYVSYADYEKLVAEIKDLQLVRGRLLELLEDAKSEARVEATGYKKLEAENATLKADAEQMADAILAISMTLGDRFTDAGQRIVDSYLVANKYKRSKGD